jgi:hypothetical protein
MDAALRVHDVASVASANVGELPIAFKLAQADIRTGVVFARLFSSRQILSNVFLRSVSRLDV